MSSLATMLSPGMLLIFGVAFVLARGIGQAFLESTIDPRAVRSLLDEALAA